MSWSQGLLSLNIHSFPFKNKEIPEIFWDASSTGVKGCTRFKKVQNSSASISSMYRYVQCPKTATPTAKSRTLREDGALLVANAFKLLLFPGKNLCFFWERGDVLSGIDESDVFVQRYPGICNGLHMLASSFGRGFLPNMLAPSCRLKNPAKFSSTYTFAAIRNSAQFYRYNFIISCILNKHVSMDTQNGVQWSDPII